MLFMVFYYLCDANLMQIFASASWVEWRMLVIPLL